MGTSTYEYQSDFARKYYGEGRDEGRAEGEARAVLAVLAARGLSLDPAQRDRIATCTDLHQLDIWVQRAALVSDADELFD